MNLQRYFFYWSVAMVLFISFYAIFGPKSIPVDLKSINFKSTESAELYFKNIRSYSYDRAEENNGKLILYRIKSRTVDTAEYGINFLIVSNWLEDENYIIAESYPYNFLEEGLQIKNNNQTDTLFLGLNDVEANYIFAAHFYEELSEESKFYIIDSSGNPIQLAISEGQKKSLKKSLKDYFKLVGKIR